MFILIELNNCGDVAKYFAKMFMFVEHFKNDIVSLREFKDKFFSIWCNKYVTIHPDKYIVSFIKNFTALVSLKKNVDRRSF
ncbi:MAG: hypothetical protein LBL02_01210 [Endomicrobium sp.]|nr:hypothetical protein [Endomicrobium sp.]